MSLFQNMGKIFYLFNSIETTS